MNKRLLVLFGAGKLGIKACSEYEERVAFFIDNYKAGSMVMNKKVISLNEFVLLYDPNEFEVVICVYDCNEIIKVLHKNDIVFSLYHGIYLDSQAPLSTEIEHGKWINKLTELCDKPGFNVLEVGARVVTGANFRKNFKYANYVGFDLYEGENVDVVGDAHSLSNYFHGRKFDLVFCSAVFEHFAMPWLVADEMIKLCKKGGYIFIETHYSYRSHERPWHFFQFSEQALKILFSESRGIKCIEAGVSNPMVGWFSDEASEYLRGRFVNGLYCHSEFLGQKEKDVVLSWNKAEIKDFGSYPLPQGGGNN